MFRFNPFKTVLTLPIRAVFIDAIIKTGKTLALTEEGLSPLFTIARKSSCKFLQLLNLAQALGQSTEYNAKEVLLWIIGDLDLDLTPFC